MKFQVSRTSQGSVAADPPCPGAIRGPEAVAWPGEYSWFIELNSIDDLVRFLEQNGGGLGVWSPEEGEEYPAIEIFDEDEEDE